MNRKQLLALGLRPGPALDAARGVLSAHARSDPGRVKSLLAAAVADPRSFTDDPVVGPVTAALLGPDESRLRDAPAPFRVWGVDPDGDAARQLEQACRLPVAARGALMPDAHLGYGLPIGGVLATEGAVVPYAVGVDIACRVMISVLDVPVGHLETRRDTFVKAIEVNSRFGVASSFEDPKWADVLDDDWDVTPVTAGVKDLAWRQLGTSGSGNHFVEFGVLDLGSPVDGVPAGSYTALVSHSGSRGPGARVATHYSRLASSLRPELGGPFSRLAWLSLGSGPGDEYWAAMELMGRYASANHHVIHRDVVRAAGGNTLLVVENHHNFAWKETHDGREVVVHRKGATPAGPGVRGYIPGTMIHPGYLVEGLGEPSSLRSASHGAGRTMSRKAAREVTTRKSLAEAAGRAGVTLVSAGLDESPAAYKDIDAVMGAQRDLVRTLGRFVPRVVKMAPDGERREE